jgi:hypothetical protein
MFVDEKSRSPSKSPTKNTVSLVVRMPEHTAVAGSSGDKQDAALRAFS